MRHAVLSTPKSNPANLKIYIIALLCLACTTAAALADEGHDKSAGKHITTRWAKNVSPDNVWPEYPRPTMVRDTWLNLNGTWLYAIAPKDQPQPEQFTEKILVPFAIESALSGVQKTVGPDNKLWYKRSFELPSSWAGQRVLLHFGAVDWETTVWLNGKNIGSHRGGYDPFSFDITDVLNSTASQELVLSVWDPTDAGYQPRGKQVRKPNGIWYTSVTGIWQTVWLEPVPQTYIKKIKITPNIDRSEAIVTAEFAGPVEGCVLDAVITPGQFRPGKLPKHSVAQSTIKLRIQDPVLWSPDLPFLYNLEITLKKDNVVCDKVTSYLGMRKIEVKPDTKGITRIFLNDRPLFQLGTLDQGWWPDGLYTAPSEEAMRYDLEVLKNLGFNMIRKHVKIEPSHLYYLCDKIGLLVWQDMPSGDKYIYPQQPDSERSDESAKQFYTELRAMMDTLGNHPSIVAWVAFNEGWGQFQTEDVTTTIKNYDPTRLVDSASGWADRGSGDVLDIHHYPEPAIPDNPQKRAAVLGEFGGLGLPLKGHSWQDEQNFSYRGYEDSDKLTDAYLQLIETLKPMVKNGLSAAVYTQTSDVEMEVNGLITYDREIVKMDAKKVAQANKQLYSANDTSSITQVTFGSMDGKPVYLYTMINNNNLKAQITNYGGILVALNVPDRNGKFADVTLGHGQLDRYIEKDMSPYFGAIVGRYGNRIANGKFTLDGKEYKLAINNSPNHLHGGIKGFDKVIWDSKPYETTDGVALELSYLSRDGEEGYPGNLSCTVIYHLTNENELRITYKAQTDKATPVNLTHHSYFNLAGQTSGKNILNHQLMINADQFLPVNQDLIPLGSPADVKGTPMDFTSATAIGARINNDDPQLKNGGGYDHNWILRGKDGSFALAATVYEPNSGRVMEVYTTEPGLQFYSGNFLDGSIKGKNGSVYNHRGGFCLETQHFPDSPNKPQYPTTILKPGEQYYQLTSYKFSARR